jgi:hypothetical protein
MKLSLNAVPARQGQRWLLQGWQVFRQAPLPLSALLATYLVAWMVVSLLGVLGLSLLLASLPLLSLAYMLATHQVLQKRAVGFSVWAQPFKLTPQRTRAQLQLCALYLISTVLLMLLAAWVDGGALERLQDAMANAGRDEAQAKVAEAAVLAALSDPQFFWGMVLRLIGATLISVPFWHAPALVHWGGHGALKALFGSCVGIWTNRAAFVVNGLLWVGVLLAGSLVLSVLLAIVGGGALASLLVMPMVLLMSTVFYCGLYFTFVDCFRFIPDDPAPAHER